MEIKGYNYKKKPRFLGKADWYIGIELEVEAPNYTENSDMTCQFCGFHNRTIYAPCGCCNRAAWHKRRKKSPYDRGLELRDNPQSLYIKHDGSINNGYEIVTEPIPWHKWLGKPKKDSSVYNFMRLTRQMQSLGFTSHKSGRCGMHVHISNQAVDLPLYRSIPADTHNSQSSIPRYNAPEGTVPRPFYWFRRIVNDPVFYDLSQRTPETMSQWAMQLPEYYREYNGVRLVNSRRHEAVNIRTGTTVETRIFRGNMREASIRKNLEAIIATVQMAREYTDKNIDPSTCAGMRGPFVQHVSNNKKTYPHLYDYIQKRDIQKERTYLRGYNRLKMNISITTRQLKEEYKRYIIESRPFFLRMDQTENVTTVRSDC